MRIFTLFLICLVELTFISPSFARDPAQTRAFRKLYSCPATGKKSGPCPNWIIDHIVPLCWGGKDEPANMMWQPKGQSFIKNKFELEACALKKACRKLCPQ